MSAERLLKHYERIADSSDAVARLRRFVLDLAVRGKLVPQNPNDEPASELLKRIVKEKARLVKAGEIKAAKPLSVDPSKWLGATLPSGWQSVPFSATIRSHRGGVHRRKASRNIGMAISAGQVSRTSENLNTSTRQSTELRLQGWLTARLT